ncbi:insulin-like growth factor-binding protein complex acid labile subunit [Oppia nitens]|uniref:insulin-like growth factor-binding protein complex acid labile subunit n=1 Tax=Oppia nitens TaxID=1686743 RepID=UPI0023DB07DD|nr:insulin-like growth factor-binding protein complex acid labile subunit [Oppia nitens]
MAKGSVTSLIIQILLFKCLTLDNCVARRSSPVFSASLPGRCPSPPCECAADEFNRKRVICSAGGLTGIPVEKMDKEIQVLNITAPESNANKIALGRIFLELHQLEEVHITYSNLPAIGDSSFWPGKALKLLNLSHNSISIVRDNDFNQLNNLLTLDLSDNHLSRAPSAAFRYLTNLTTLSLARNRFTKLVPRLFFKLDNLQVLDLSGNPLREIYADDFKDIKNLTVLNLSKCLLEKMHSLVYKGLPNLTYLDLSYNQFVYLASNEFNLLVKLKVLLLNGNRLSVLLDNTFSGLHGLDFLNLSSNQINAIYSCTFCNSSVTSLDISDNKFTSFQTKILEPLSDSLRQLTANENRQLIDSTTSVAYLIQPLKRLNHLSLAFNSLDDTLIDSTFYNLDSLLSLNLTYNKFANISARLFHPLINLKSLDLSHNQIYGLGYQQFAQINALSKLEAIYLNDNPWSCFRCHIMPAMEWIDSSPTAYFNVCHRYSKEVSRLQHCIKCLSPLQLSSRYLHLLNQFDLEWCIDPNVQLRLTASEPQIGLILAIFIIMSLVFIIIAVIVFYRKQGAVYYTHEDDLFIDEKIPVPQVFSVAAHTSVKQPIHSYMQSPQPPPPPPPPPSSHFPPSQSSAVPHCKSHQPSLHSSPSMSPSLTSKPDSPKAGPSSIPPSVIPVVVMDTNGAPERPILSSQPMTTTTMRIIRPKVQIYI